MTDWREAVVYQIYPASFQDSNEDGIGDLRGIIARLDYVKDLGADMIWLSPINQSPQKDMGYDISDYRQIHAPYGSLQDVDELISQMRARDMKLIMDLVVNHTSDEHAWFKESRSSKSSSKRDWYIWRAPRIDPQGKRGPPNNWRSVFGGSAWEWDDTSKEYYLHMFAVEQPDLNWENCVVVQAVHADMEFWLKKGIGGFRIDAFGYVSKHPDLPDAPISDPSKELQAPELLAKNGPRIHEHLYNMNRLFEKYDIMTVGEMSGVDEVDDLLLYVGKSRQELDTLFQFDQPHLPTFSDLSALEAQFAKVKYLKTSIRKWQGELHGTDGWPTIYLENHDIPRSISKMVSDSDEYREVCAKLLALYASTMWGTLYVYQGQEIGMRNVPPTWLVSEYLDVSAQNAWREFTSTGQRTEAERTAWLSELRGRARDNARTPMQWDASTNAGFSAGKPWMRVNDDYKECNVSLQKQHPDSVLGFWKQCLRMRREYKDVLLYGSFELNEESVSEGVIAYDRTSSAGTFRVLLNFAPCEGSVASSSGSWELVLGNRRKQVGSGSPIKLAAFEGVVLRRKD